MKRNQKAFKTSKYHVSYGANGGLDDLQDLLGSFKEKSLTCWRQQRQVNTPVIIFQGAEQSQVRVARGVVSLWGSWGTGMTHTSGPSSAFYGQSSHVRGPTASNRDEQNVPNTPVSDSGVPGDGLGLFSALTRGERVGCRGLMVKQSVRAPWVADLICKHSKSSTEEQETGQRNQK